MIILVPLKNEKDQAHIFQDTSFERFQVHQLTIMYRFEEIYHDSPLIFLFQNLYKICMRVICISNMFHVYVTV